MMTTSRTLHRYYNPAQKPLFSLSKLFLSSQSKVFSSYQSQQLLAQAQLPWQGLKRPADLIQPIPVGGLQRQYSIPPFRKTFMPQGQQYLTNN